MNLSEQDHEKIRDLLLWKKVTKVSETTLQLEDGTTLEFLGNQGCAGCSSGWYELTELNDCENAITGVAFENAPWDDDVSEERYDKESGGHYRIFVLAENTAIKLAEFEGSDGNGYYGTGYSIRVKFPDGQ